MLMKKVRAMWGGLGVAGFTAGALVVSTGGECTTMFCWGGAAPGLLMILAGVLATVTVSRRLPALGTGVVGGGLTGLSVSLGAGASVLSSGSSAAGGTSINLANCPDDTPRVHPGLRGCDGWGDCSTAHSTIAQRRRIADPLESAEGVHSLPKTVGSATIGHHRSAMRRTNSPKSPPNSSYCT